MKTQIDHLVVAAATLEQGVAWCEATLGITPGPGGEHALFGTHNRLFKIATPAHPLAYLEVIAVNPAAVRPDNAPSRRWFDLDDPQLRSAIATAPRLIHFVVSTSDVHGAYAALRAQGIERGPVLPASRQSPRGLLQWQMTVRDDGQRLFQGALPTLTQWGAPGDAEPLRLHPRNNLPRSGVSLHNFAVTHPEADRLRAAYEAIGLASVVVEAGTANIAATLHTPKGAVRLESLGL